MKLKDLKLHKIVTLLPIMSMEEFRTLKQNIKEHGIKEPLVVINNEIIDGRHRYLVARELCIEEVPIRELGKIEESLESYVLSLNLSRRHLGQGQRALIALNVFMVQLNHEINNLTVSIDTAKRRKGFLIDNVSKIAGVGLATVKRVKYIVDNGTPEEIESLRNGSKTANKVQSTIKRRLSPLKEKVVIEDVVDNNILRRKIDKNRLAFVNSNGNNIQRTAVKNNSRILDQIYDAVISSQNNSNPPTPNFAPPQNIDADLQIVDLKEENERLVKESEELKAYNIERETEFLNLQDEVECLRAGKKYYKKRDYTKLEGSDITAKELDDAKLALSDHKTYVRLMTENRKCMEIKLQKAIDAKV